MGEKFPSVHPAVSQARSRAQRTLDVKILHEHHAGVIMASIVEAMFSDSSFLASMGSSKSLEKLDAMADIAIGAADSLARKLVDLRQ